MANPTEDFGFGTVQDFSTSINRSSEGVDRSYGGQKVCQSERDGWIEVAGTDSDYGFYDQGNSSEKGLPFFKYQLKEHQRQPYLCHGRLLDDLSFDMLSPPFRTYLEDIPMFEEKKSSVQNDVESKKEMQKFSHFPLASLELLKRHGGDPKRAMDEKVIQPSHKSPFTREQETSQMYSTEEIIRLAGARFIQSTQRIDVETMFNNPYDLSFSGLSRQEEKKVELVEFLLASAEKVGNEQFEKASRLLKYCDENSSGNGNAVERLVFYFCNALQERIDRETGRIAFNGEQKEQRTSIYEAMMAPSHSNIAFHQGIPFYQVSNFAGVQAIIENVADAKRIHIIDLEIRNGQQWTILMQALESRRECPVELLRITALGTTSKQLIENTGNRLMNFAQTVNLPLLFNVIMVSDFLDLKEDQFGIDSDETVAVYCEYLLPSLVAQPERLDSLMKVIKNINPCIMVICEVEANHNSPVFVNRFIEALFYTSAYFDCLDTCMEQDDPNRIVIEAKFFGEAVVRILAKEGGERLFRNVKLSVWRDYFVRFGMKETELSMSSQYQAELVLKNFSCGSFCTLKMDKKSLIIGWKGTPIHFVSAWKFICQ